MALTVLSYASNGIPLERITAPASSSRGSRPTAESCLARASPLDAIRRRRRMDRRGPATRLADPSYGPCPGWPPAPTEQTPDRGMVPCCNVTRRDRFSRTARASQERAHDPASIRRERRCYSGEDVRHDQMRGFDRRRRDAIGPDSLLGRMTELVSELSTSVEPFALLIRDETRGPRTPTVKNSYAK